MLGGSIQWMVRASVGTFSIANVDDGTTTFVVDQGVGKVFGPDHGGSDVDIQDALPVVNVALDGALLVFRLSAKDASITVCVFLCVIIYRGGKKGEGVRE